MNYNLSDMTPRDIENLISMLQKLLGEKFEDKSTISKIVKQESNELVCPHCHKNDNVIKNGFTKNKIQRYKCKSCKKTFISTTGTVCYHSKLTLNDWKTYFECMSDDLSIRKTAAKMGKNKNTVFAMRHKVLKSLASFRNNTKMEGKIEADETTLPINFKGMKQTNMPRFSKKRGHASKIKNHKVCILGAIDEHDNYYLEIVDNGSITTEDIRDSLGNKLNNASYLITDCNPAYEKFASENNLKLEQVKSGTYKNNDGYTLSEINGLHSNLFTFLYKFRGVSTKHLQGYIDWFLYKKYISYAKEIIDHPKELFYYSIKQKTNITIKEIYNAPFPFDVTEAYSDYASTTQI